MDKVVMTTDTVGYGRDDMDKVVLATAPRHGTSRIRTGRDLSGRVVCRD